MRNYEFERANNYSPLNKIKTVLLAPPGVEAALGLLMPPKISLFEADFNSSGSIVLAREDHVRMQGELAANNIDVIDMRRVIGEALAEKQGYYKNIDQLKNELFKRTLFLHQKYQLGSIKETRSEIESLLKLDVDNIGEDAAIAINAVLTNCTDRDGRYMSFDVTKPPMANFMFWRDTNHISGDEVATHTMHYSIRDQEVALAEIGLRKLGIEHQRLRLGKNESIEGGDILPVEINGKRLVLIGYAERTTCEGVRSFFNYHKKLWRDTNEGIIPALVEGVHSQTQNQMHLDTWFQQVGPDTAIYCGELASMRRISFLKGNGEIRKVDTMPFDKWISKNFAHTYDMSRPEQLNYAPNVLVDGTEAVFITREGNPQVDDFLRKHTKRTVELKMNSLTKMYGGAHCATSELRY